MILYITAPRSGTNLLNEAINAVYPTWQQQRTHTHIKNRSKIIDYLSCGKYHAVVFLQRRNTIRQAISWLRAEEAEIYHACTPGRLEKHRDYNGKISVERIHKYRNSLNTDGQYIESILQASQISQYALWYEDIEKPAGLRNEVANILAFLGVAIDIPETIPTTLLKTADALTEEWYDKYLLYLDDISLQQNHD